MTMVSDGTDFREHDRSNVTADDVYFAKFFARLYYNVHYNPGSASRLYNETTILSVPNGDGTMTTVTTLNDIIAKIESLDFGNSIPKIETVVSQHSHSLGIIFVVVGAISGTDEVERKFTQTFFLAPQPNGFFLQNDVAPFAFAPETLSGGPFEEKESEMVKEINEYLNQIGQDDSLTVNRSYASIVKGPKAAASGASNSRWTPIETSKRILGSRNLFAEPTASPPSCYVGPQSSNPLKGANSISKGVIVDAQEIAANFLKQYYHVLCKTPELANQFYNETSNLSWLNSDGRMTKVTTLKGIHAEIRSRNFANSMPIIKTVVAQDSHDLGIIVVVTGAIIGTGDVRKEFTQTFFLAPQERGEGYFVRNDIALITSASVVPLVTVEAENTKESEMVKEIVNEQSKDIGQNGSMTVNSPDSSGATEKKKSYASIVKLPKTAASGASNLRGNATKTGIRKLGPTIFSAEPTASPLTSDIGCSNLRKVEGHSVYIQNLPLNATVTYVTEEFRKFGNINDGGVQLKIHEDFGYCYGFVEFQSLDSMENAIKESPLHIGDHNVVVRKKE